MHFKKDSGFRRRVIALAIVAILILGIFIFRLADFQLIDASPRNENHPSFSSVSMPTQKT